MIWVKQCNVSAGKASDVYVTVLLIEVLQSMSNSETVIKAELMYSKMILIEVVGSVLIIIWQLSQQSLKKCLTLPQAEFEGQNFPQKRIKITR